MNSLLEFVDSQTVLLVAAIVVSLLLLKLLFRILNVSLGLILTIVAVVVVLQYLFGISPRHLWFEISHLPQDLLRIVKNLG